jgi:hypothetical protein
MFEPLVSNIVADEWFKSLLGHHMLVFPQKSASWIRLPWLSDTDSHNFSLVVQLSRPQNQHPGSTRVGFPTRIRIRGHLNNGVFKKDRPSSEIAG